MEANNKPAEAQPVPEASDPFDPSALRLADATAFGVEKVLTAVPCDKPNRHVFVRTHRDEAYRLDTGLFFDKSQGNEAYLVAPAIRNALAGDVVAVRLFTATTRHGDVFLWPVRLPGPDGRSNPWHESIATAAEMAVDNWIRVSANMLAGRYDVVKATGNLPEPEWPNKSLKELLQLSFENRHISGFDHPILKSLRGEV